MADKVKGVVRSRRGRDARGRRVVWLGVAALVATLLGYGIVANGLLAGSVGSGDIAPDVTLGTANGELRLSSQHGKVLVLYFSFPG